ncbi:UNVERIFIED_CONTAM: hypothetical protein K2H54_021546 [Gekko kuhli]
MMRCRGATCFPSFDYMFCGTRRYHWKPKRECFRRSPGVVSSSVLSKMAALWPPPLLRGKEEPSASGSLMAPPQKGYGSNLRTTLWRTLGLSILYQGSSTRKTIIAQKDILPSTAWNAVFTLTGHSCFQISS